MSKSMSIIIVEDEPLLSMLLEDFVETLGHEVVGSAPSVEKGLSLVDKGGFDAAIIDINLSGEAAWPIADALADRSIPFVIATGGLIQSPPARHQDVRILAKPYVLDKVEQALDEI